MQLGKKKKKKKAKKITTLMLYLYVWHVVIHLTSSWLGLFFFLMGKMNLWLLKKWMAIVAHYINIKNRPIYTQYS